MDRMLKTIKTNMLDRGIIINENPDKTLISIDNTVLMALDILGNSFPGNDQVSVSQMENAMSILVSKMTLSKHKDYIMKTGSNKNQGISELARTMLSSNDLDLQMSCLSAIVGTIAFTYNEIKDSEVEDVGEKIIKELEIKNANLEKNIKEYNNEKDRMIEEIKKLKEENYTLRRKNDKLKRVIDHK